MAKCNGCGAEIKFIKTKAGKMMPVDNKPQTFIDIAGNVKTVYISHFATCPQANQFRKKEVKNDVP